MKKVEDQRIENASRRHFVQTMAVLGVAAGSPAVLTGCLGSDSSGDEPFDPADVIYTNAKVITLDASEPDKAGAIAQGVAVKDGVIVRVGTEDEVLALRGSETRVVDLAGKTVVPGFIDAHTHPMETAMMKETFVNCRYPDCPSVAEALNRIAAWAATTLPGNWIFAAGVSASQNKFAEKALPTKAQLDQAAPNNPVAFANGTHMAVVNSLALKALGVGSGPPNGVVKLEHGGAAQLDENGNPTGVLTDAMADIPAKPTPEQAVRYFTTSIPALWNRWGFTSVMAITPADALPALQSVAATPESRPTLRMTVSVWKTANGSGVSPQDVASYAMPAAADRRWYRTGGLKVWVDGENDARTGYMYEPYLGSFPTDPPGGIGSLVTPQEQAIAYVTMAASAGLMPMLHVSGDQAMDIGLNAYDALLASGAGKAPVIRLEHFGVFQMYDEHLARAKAMYAKGLRISVQPTWMLDLIKADYENMGTDRTETGFRFRSMIDAGLKPAAGTDVTGIYLDNLNPFLGIHAAVNRASDWSAMEPFLPMQRINVVEALRMWTIWAAHSMGEDAFKGTIEVGKYADMTVLSDDVLTMDQSELQNVKVLMTIAGGEVVYSAG